MTRPPRAEEPPVKVLYVAGVGRSGSTVLECLLNLAPGYAACGEVTFLWERGLRGRHRCGCGETIPACAVWGPVVAEIPADQQEEAWTLHRRLARFRSLPAHLLGGGVRRREALARYRTILSRVYRARARATGATVLVDTSTYPAFGAVLAGAPGLDVRLLQLVRDPRGCAFSWQRRKQRPEVDEPGAEMPRLGPGYVALEWMVSHLGSEWLAGQVEHATRRRYEDFAEAPVEALLAIGDLMDEPVDAAAVLAQAAQGLGSNHTVSGNPLRFLRSGVEVRLDREWESALPWWPRILVTGMTLPLLARYGYLDRG